MRLTPGGFAAGSQMMMTGMGAHDAQVGLRQSLTAFETKSLAVTGPGSIPAFLTEDFSGEVQGKPLSQPHVEIDGMLTNRQSVTHGIPVSRAHFLQGSKHP